LIFVETFQRILRLRFNEVVVSMRFPAIVHTCQDQRRFKVCEQALNRKSVFSRIVFSFWRTLSGNLFSKKEKMFIVDLVRKDFPLWLLFACSFCRCIWRLLQVALSFLWVLCPLPFCRGVFHDLDEVELSTKLTPKQI